MEKTQRQQDLIERLRQYKEQKLAEKVKKQPTKTVTTQKTPGQPLTHGSRDATTRRALASKQPTHTTGSVLAKSTTATARRSTTRSAKVKSCPVGTVEPSTKKTIKAQTRAPIKRLSFSKIVVDSKETQENVTPKRKRTSSFTIEEHEASPVIKRPIITDDTESHVATKKLKLETGSAEAKAPRSGSAEAKAPRSGSAEAKAPRSGSAVAKAPRSGSASGSKHQEKNTVHVLPVQKQAKWPPKPPARVHCVSRPREQQKSHISPRKPLSKDHMKDKHSAQSSMRDRLEMWRQEKEQKNLVGQGSRSGKEECPQASSAPYTKRVSSRTRSPISSNHRSSVSATLSNHRRSLTAVGTVTAVGTETRRGMRVDSRSVGPTRAEIVQRRKSHAGPPPTRKVDADSVLQRRKSYAPQVHGTSVASRPQVHGTSVASRPQVHGTSVASRPQVHGTSVASRPAVHRPRPGVPATVTQASKPTTSVTQAGKPTTSNLHRRDLHSRRKSSYVPITQKTGDKDNVLNRRKSYALALREQVQTKSSSSSSGQNVHKRRMTVAGVCLSTATVTTTETKSVSAKATRQSPRIAQSGATRAGVSAVKYDTKTMAHKEPKLAPVEPHLTPVEPELTTEQPQLTPEEPQLTTEEPQLTTEQPQLTPEEPQLTPVEPDESQLIPLEPITPDILPTKTPKSCRKSMSVRFASPDSEKVTRTTATPVSALKMDHVAPVTPARLSPLRKEQSIRDKLNVWLESRGRTPSRFSHMLRFGDRLSSEEEPAEHSVKGGLSINDLSHQQDALTHEDSVVHPDNSHFANSHIDDPLTQKLDAILSECLILLEFDCPTDTVEQWIKQICSNLEGVQQVAKYWICMAKLAQRSGDDNAVISVFEESVRHNAQPPEEIAEALKDFVDHMSVKQAKRQSLNNSLAQQLPCTPKPRATGMQEENVFTSSAIKYCYTETTPFFNRLRSKSRRIHSTPYAVVTPVRRSTRRSINTLPAMFQDHDTIVDSLNQLSLENKEQALFVRNRALNDSLGQL